MKGEAQLHAWKKADVERPQGAILHTFACFFFRYQQHFGIDMHSYAFIFVHGALHILHVTFYEGDTSRSG